jgi:hypothetical protein
MTEEPIKKIEFEKPLSESSFKGLLKHLFSHFNQDSCKIFYNFREEGILDSEFPNRSSLLDGECEGDIRFEKKKITLNYRSKKNELNLYSRMNLYYNPVNKNNLEEALAVAEEIKRSVSFFLQMQNF